MSEPTIYKPSIYKGPTIYNTGSGGGGGGTIIGGWPFDKKYNMVDYGTSSITKSNCLIIDFDENCFYRNIVANTTSSFDNYRCPRYYRNGGNLNRSDDLEISIDFKINAFGTTGGASVILSGTTSWFNETGSCSIDLYNDDKKIEFVMANNNSWGDAGNICSVISDKITLEYLSNNICNVKVKHYANTDDFEIWFEGEQSTDSAKTFTSPKYGGSCDHVIGGIYNHLNSISNGLGKIYFSSYVKYNGDFLPLA